MPKVDIITGKYGGYVAMRPMIRLVQAKSWDVTLHVCDQHLEEKWGSTSKEVERDFPDSRFLWDHDGFTRVEKLFRVGSNISRHWGQQGNPDCMIVYGDRMDALIGATVAHQSGVPVAHLQAGDRSGCIDNATRTAVSAISTWHFAPTQDSKNWLYSYLGCAHAYNVGDHHLDAVREVKINPTPPIEGKYLVVHMHPDTLLSYEENVKEARGLKAILAWLNIPYVTILSCNDMHYKAMDILSVDAVRVHSNLPHTPYINLLYHSEALIGNTSSVYIEAPYLGIRAIDIGNRQTGRDWKVPKVSMGLGGVRSLERIRGLMAAPKLGKNYGIDRGDGTAGEKTIKILEGLLCRS